METRGMPIALARVTVAISLLALILVLATGPSDAIAEGSTDPNIVVYGGCDRAADTPPSHLCHRGNKLGAFFKSEGTNLFYTVCVKFPEGKRPCATGQESTQGTLYVNKITNGIDGRIKIFWYVNSVEVGSWELNLVPDPVVPEFGLNPLIVAGSHHLAGLLIKHVRPGLRVRAWRGCHGICRLRLRLVDSGRHNRRYVIAGQHKNSAFNLGAILYVEVDAPGTREHGFSVWGRLFIGKLVRNGRGNSSDTAIRRVGPILCTPPGAAFEAGTSCDTIP